MPLLQYFGPNTTVLGPGCTLFIKINLGVKPELMATHLIYSLGMNFA